MANPYRGDVAARLGGRERTLRLTLGALAELEQAFAAEDLVDLSARFASGRLTARDAIRVIAAGLRGAGEAVTDEEVAAMPAEGGAAGYVAIVARLLAATFGSEAEAGGPGSAGTGGGDREARPFDRPPPAAASPGPR